MRILNTHISDLMVVETSQIGDSRGAFMRLYCEDELRLVIGQRRILQINHSRSVSAGTVRGLHFQYPPHSEMKLVRCIKGRVYDVAVDLRQNSSTFLQWHAEELTPINARMLVIPEGFAHGFQALDSDSELLYLHTAFYKPRSEGGFRYDDPTLAINWPLTATNISSKDFKNDYINLNFKGIKI
jgi:dTDP-4-dehydrorhamnose 3,5-epimerase